MEDIKKEMGKNEFRELAKDMEPVIAQMEEVLKRNDVTNLVSLTMDVEGYFHFQPHNSDWEFKRLNTDSRPKLSMTICEDL